MDLGIDFGSSFSIVSYCKEGANGIEPQPIKFNEGESDCIPTIACIRKGSNDVRDIEAGLAAQNDIGRDDFLHFRAPKMLLNAKESEWKRHPDYSDKLPPEKIAEAFLKDIVENALFEKGEDRANLVVCVPDIWAKGIRNPDPKSTLYNICKGIPGVEHVKIVTEPEAASAYSAYAYFKDKAVEYNGMILIIDYGGGTLDLSLTRVEHTKKDGKQLTHIQSCGHGGQGENHDGQIGIAGIAYMTRVAEIALCAAHPELASGKESTYLKDYDKVSGSAEFLELYQQVESKIKSKNKDLKKKVDRIYNNDPGRMRDDNDMFFDVRLGNGTIEVSYSMLYQAYMEIVHDTLEYELNLIDPNIATYVKDLKDENQDGFKIALVGGFGKFALVEQQVYLHYAIARPAKDKRINQEVMLNREYAIANGAALIANGQVMIRRTAPQGIGLVGRTQNKEETYFMAIDYGQLMEDKEVYYVCNPGTNRPITMVYGGTSEFEFAVSVEQNANWVKVYKLNEEYWKKVRSRVSSGQILSIGFRIDDSDVISMIISDGKLKQLGEPIKLDCFERIFLSDGINFDDARIIHRRK